MSSLGNNPLYQQSPQVAGIFQKTDPESLSRNQNQESRIKKKLTDFLADEDKEKVNLRLPLELVDWLDEIVKQGKRNHGQKIAKELWLQAALELLRSAPVAWEEIDSIEKLKETLQSLSFRFNEPQT